MHAYLFMTSVGLTTFLMQIGQQLSFPSVMEEVRLMCSRRHCSSIEHVSKFFLQGCDISALIVPLYLNTVQFAQQNKANLLPWKKWTFRLFLHPAARDNKRYKVVVGIHCPMWRPKCTKAHRQPFIQKDIYRQLLMIVTVNDIIQHVRINYSVYKAIKNIELGYTTAPNYWREVDSTAGPHVAS